MGAVVKKPWRKYAFLITVAVVCIALLCYVISSQEVETPYKIFSVFFTAVGTIASFAALYYEMHKVDRCPYCGTSFAKKPTGFTKCESCSSIKIGPFWRFKMERYEREKKKRRRISSSSRQ